MVGVNSEVKVLTIWKEDDSCRFSRFLEFTLHSTQETEVLVLISRKGERSALTNPSRPNSTP